MLGTDGTPNRDGVRLGRIIRDRRGALNMTQPELAERAGVSPAYIYMLEVGGLPHPGLESLLRVAKAIDQTRLAELLEEAGGHAGGRAPAAQRGGGGHGGGGVPLPAGDAGLTSGGSPPEGTRPAGKGRAQGLADQRLVAGS